MLIAGLITALGGASAALASLSLAALALFVPVLLLAASQTAVSLVNWAAMVMAKPKILPRLDFDDGVPLECRTLVVVPTVISSCDDVDRLLELLEVRYLGNRDPQISFALLSDLPAADSEVMPCDAELIARAVAGTEELNSRYAIEGRAPFFLLHRPRQWNPREERFMGYERKRGAIEALNRLLIEGPGRPLRRDRRRSLRSPGDALRDHARRRHRAPAGRGAQADRDRRAPAQPAGGGSRACAAWSRATACSSPGSA